MAHCNNNKMLNDDFLPPLEREDALNFIKALKYPELFEHEEQECKAKGEELKSWVKIIGRKYLNKKEEENEKAKENVVQINDDDA